MSAGRRQDHATFVGRKRSKKLEKLGEKAEKEGRAKDVKKGKSEMAGSSAPIDFAAALGADFFKAKV